MAERRPLVQIDGQVQELPQGDTIPGASGGGGGGGTTADVIQSVDLGTFDLSVNTLDAGNEINIDMTGYEWAEVELDGGTFGSSDTFAMRVGVTTADGGASDYENWLFNHSTNQWSLATNFMRLSGDGTSDLHGRSTIRGFNDATVQTVNAGDHYAGAAGYRSSQKRAVAQADDVLQILARDGNAATGGTVRVTGYRRVSAGGSGGTPSKSTTLTSSTVDQAVTEAVDTTINFDGNTNTDVGSLAAGVFTVTDDGLYMLYGTAYLYNGNAGDITLDMAVKINGVAIGEKSNHYHTESWGMANQGLFVESLTAGDTVEFFVHYSGGSPATMNIDEERTYASITLLGSSSGAGGGSADYPDFTGNAGNTLRVNQAEDGVEWFNNGDAFNPYAPRFQTRAYADWDQAPYGDMSTAVVVESGGSIDITPPSSGTHAVYKNITGFTDATFCLELKTNGTTFQDPGILFKTNGTNDFSICMGTTGTASQHAIRALEWVGSNGAFSSELISNTVILGDKVWLHVSRPETDRIRVTYSMDGVQWGFYGEFLLSSVNGATDITGIGVRFGGTEGLIVHDYRDNVDEYSIKGQKGDAGAAGADGTNGTNGTDGADGADGQGVPTGGTAGQVLKKIDGTDFNTEWADESGGGGGGSPSGKSFYGFRAGLTVNTGLSAAFFGPIPFDKTDFDSETALTSHSRFTVPASMDGKYVEFTAGLSLQANTTVAVYLRKSTDGGSNWTTFSKSATNENACNINSGTVLLTEGDMYECWAFVSGASTMTAPDTFWSMNLEETGVGIISQDSVESFRAIADGSQNAVNNVLTRIILQTTQHDDMGGYDNTTGIFTVPAALDGKTMEFMGGVRNNDSGGTMYLRQNGSILSQVGGGSVNRYNVTSGPIKVSTGDTFDIAYYFSTTNALEANYTWFGGYVLPAQAENIPAGGTTGQVLAKIDDTDFNAEWVDQTGGSGASVDTNAARYWRARGTVAGSYDGGALADIDFQTAAGVSLIGGGTASAGSEDFGGTAAGAFDQSTGTMWAGTGGAVAAGDSWVAYDFGVDAAQVVEKVVITARSSSNSNQMWDEWVLEWSDDGLTWNTLETINDTSSWSSNEVKSYDITNRRADVGIDFKGVYINNASASGTLAGGMGDISDNEAIFAMVVGQDNGTFNNVTVGGTAGELLFSDKTGSFDNIQIVKWEPGVLSTLASQSLVVNGGSSLYRVTIFFFGISNLETNDPNAFEFLSDMTVTSDAVLNLTNLNEGDAVLAAWNTDGATATVTGDLTESVAAQNPENSFFTGASHGVVGSSGTIDYNVADSGTNSRTYGVIAVFPKKGRGTTDYTYEEKEKLASLDVFRQEQINVATYSTVNNDFSGGKMKLVRQACTITIEPGHSLKRPCSFIPTTAGAITFAAGAGVTIVSPGNLLSSRTQGSPMTLFQDAFIADTYYLMGDLA